MEEDQFEAPVPGPIQALEDPPPKGMERVGDFELFGVMAVQACSSLTTRPPDSLMR